VAQLLLMCDRQDIGISIDTGVQAGATEPTSLEPAGDTSSRVFIYDNYPGGIGFSEPLFRMHHELLAGTHRLIAECECANGCPGCVGPVGDTGPVAKAAAQRILDRLLLTLSAAVSSDGLEARSL
jgi:DEAD/DEAH box helicase domain-containing protein